jgi:hypothetical protein
VNSGPGESLTKQGSSSHNAPARPPNRGYIGLPGPPPADSDTSRHSNGIARSSCRVYTSDATCPRERFQLLFIDHVAYVSDARPAHGSAFGFYLWITWHTFLMRGQPTGALSASIHGSHTKGSRGQHLRDVEADYRWRQITCNNQ